MRKERESWNTEKKEQSFQHDMGMQLCQYSIVPLFQHENLVLRARSETMGYARGREKV